MRRRDVREAAWVEDAACKGTRGILHIPPIEETYVARMEREKKALALCGGCVVQVECLQWALQEGEKGIWGKTTDRTRRRMRGPRTT